jgi:DNA-binding SARP family transcriptional activator/DNA-binding XRE family transcriptional regulator
MIGYNGSRGGSVGPWFRGARRGAGLTQRQLAERAGVSLGFVRDLEQGRFGHPRPELTKRVANALRLDYQQEEALAGSCPAASGLTLTLPGETGSAAGADPVGRRVAGLRVGVLGPLAVSGDGAAVSDLTGAPAALLGLLALHTNENVPRHSIVDALWGERPPRSAIGMVQTYVSRLRSELGSPQDPDGEFLVRDRIGYRLILADDQLDLLVFRRLAESARARRAAGNIELACGDLEQALGLWRGEPLADIGVLQDHPAVIALAEERTTAILEYADTASSAGWHDRALPHLRVLARRDPLDEAVHARLMIALAGAGRQAEALRTYQKLQRRLDEELGMLPGTVLRAAHAKVLHQEIPVDAGPAGPDGTAQPWVPVFHLPAAPADFTGRAAECERLITAVCPAGDQPGVPLVAISGLPGVGKTSLALYAAHKVWAQFPDGQLWVQLSGASACPREAGEVLGELLRALGVHESAIPDDYSERAVCYRSRLAGRRVLIVADDAATAAQVSPLIPGTAGCALLVTSRARLEGLDAAHLMPLDVLTPDDAVGLLTQIVGSHRAAAEPWAAGELVRACGTLPLAVRIAATKLAARPSWPLAAMVRRITGHRGRLRELETGDLSVRASIASSYKSLPDHPRRAFKLLARLGPADFAEWVIAALLDEQDAADVIDELVARSLLTPLGTDSTGEPRYRLHDLLREYAAERLDDQPDNGQNDALGRLFGSWLQLAMLAADRLPPEPGFPRPVGQPRPSVVPGETAQRLTADAIAWFTTEQANLRAAVKQACHTGRLDFAHRLASHQSAYLACIHSALRSRFTFHRTRSSNQLAGSRTSA